MKITFKLAATIFAALSIVLFVNLYVGIRLQSNAAHQDAARDQTVMTTAIAVAVAAVWEAHGKHQALAVIEAANQRDAHVEIRWVDLGVTAADSSKPRVPVAPELLARLGHVNTIDTGADGNRIMLSYSPIVHDGLTHGAIEIAESLIDERHFVSQFSLTTAVAGAVMTLLSALIALVLGRRWIARPLGRLMEMTRRVGRGEFSAQADVTGTGEVAQLARAMNGMSQELELAMEQLRHADRLNTVGKLSSGVAHELGTPLHVTRGRAKAIYDEPDNPEHNRDNAEVIIRQADRMSHIIRQLLSFAHAKNLKKRTTNMLGIVNEAVAMVRPMAHKRDVEIVLPKTTDIPIVDVDPNQIQQVITNLLLNAIHASKPNGAVTLGLQRVTTIPYGHEHGEPGEYVVCFVQDEGQGIPPDSLPHVFEPFFTTREVGDGTGLGLSVALGIVREHGGWIDIATEEGSGSRFSVYLPAR